MMELNHEPSELGRESILLTVDPRTTKPASYGRGCIVEFRERIFLLTFAHATNKRGKAVCIVTNTSSDDGRASKLFSVGALLYFDVVKSPENMPTDLRCEDLDNLRRMKKLEPLDFACCEIKEDIECLQPELRIGEFEIRPGRMVRMNINYAGDPDDRAEFGFFGTVRHRLRSGDILEGEPTLRIGIQYDGVCDPQGFHRFRVPTCISDMHDYLGCSGAPIIDDSGKLVALLSSVVENSREIFGLSILKCRALLDRSI